MAKKKTPIPQEAEAHPWPYEIIPEIRFVLYPVGDRPAILMQFNGFDGRPLSGRREFPSRVRVTRYPKIFVQSHYMDLVGRPFVSTKFKEILESLDRENYEFFPMSVEDKDGYPLPGTYYLLNLLNPVDCIDFPASQAILTDMLDPCGDQILGHAPGVRSLYLHLREEAIRNRHLWMARHHGGPTFLSPTLLQACKVAGIKMRAWGRTHLVDSAGIVLPAPAIPPRDWL